MALAADGDAPGLPVDGIEGQFGDLAGAQAQPAPGDRAERRRRSRTPAPEWRCPRSAVLGSWRSTASRTSRATRSLQDMRGSQCASRPFSRCSPRWHSWSMVIVKEKVPAPRARRVFAAQRQLGSGGGDQAGDLAGAQAGGLLDQRPLTLRVAQRRRCRLERHGTGMVGPRRNRSNRSAIARCDRSCHAAKATEHLVDRRSHRLVGSLAILPTGSRTNPTGSSGVVRRAGLHSHPCHQSLLDQVPLGLAHRPLQRRQKPITIGSRNEQSLLIGYQDTRDPTDAQHLVPIAIAAGQQQHSRSENDADATQPALATICYKPWRLPEHCALMGTAPTPYPAYGLDLDRHLKYKGRSGKPVSAVLSFIGPR